VRIRGKAKLRRGEEEKGRNYFKKRKSYSEKFFPNSLTLPSLNLTRRVRVNHDDGCVEFLPRFHFFPSLVDLILIELVLVASNLDLVLLEHLEGFFDRFRIGETRSANRDVLGDEVAEGELNVLILERVENDHLGAVTHRVEKRL